MPLKAKTAELINEMETESKAFNPPLGFGFTKRWILKTVWLFKAFNQRLSALEDRG